MKKYLTYFISITFVIALTSFNVQPSENGNTKGIAFFKGTYSQGLQKATFENKKMFVYFYATWCGNCKQLKKSFKDKEVGIYYNKNFINISIDGESKEGRELMYRYQIQSYPTLLIVDFKGNVMTKSTGFLKPYILINFGRRIVP